MNFGVVPRNMLDLSDRPKGSGPAMMRSIDRLAREVKPAVTA